MVQKQEKPTALPGVLPTLAAGFDLTTRYLWLMVIPALLDLFLWIGPRLSFQTLITTLLAQIPAEALLMDPRPLLETLAPRLNHFTYLSVSFLGVPALMAGLSPERTPIAPAVITGGGWGAWAGYLLLFTAGGLLLTALFYNLIAYAMRRAMIASGRLPAAGGRTTHGERPTTNNPAPSGVARLTPARFARRTLQTWFRLMALAALGIIVMMAIVIPISLLAGFMALISQTLATFVLFGAIMLIVWALMLLGFAPQGMLLNPRPFLFAVGDSVRLLQRNLPASLGLLVIVLLLRRLLSFILLSADTGTWVTAILILAHAYIATALTVALFLFYRDRFVAHLKTVQQT